MNVILAKFAVMVYLWQLQVYNQKVFRSLSDAENQ